jgi:hypothetical protein
MTGPALNKLGIRLVKEGITFWSGSDQEVVGKVQDFIELQDLLYQKRGVAIKFIASPNRVFLAFEDSEQFSAVNERILAAKITVRAIPVFGLLMIYHLPIVQPDAATGPGGQRFMKKPASPGGRQ